MIGDCIDLICLPLYSISDDGKYVPERDGLNLWNASGRERNENEVEILIPLQFRKFFPVFFPEDAFEIILPNYVTVSAKCGKEGRVIISNPSKDLGNWILRQVLRVRKGIVINYDLLQRRGIDAVYIEKWVDGSKVFYKMFPAPAGEYEFFVTKGLKEKKPVASLSSVDNDSSSVSSTPEIPAGTQIMHKVFGQGMVKSIENDMIELDFNGTSKTFKYSWLIKNKIIKPCETAV